MEFPAIAADIRDRLVRHAAALCRAQAEVIEQCVDESLFADRVPDPYEVALVAIHEMHDSGKISISNLEWHRSHLALAKQEDVLLRESPKGMFSAVVENSG